MSATAPTEATPSRSASPLFRPEAVAAQQDQFLGGIRIGHKPGFWMVTGASVALLAACAAYAAWGEVTRKSKAAGVLVPVGGQIALSAQGMGLVQGIRVHEGQFVQAGAVLFELDVDRTGVNGSTAALVDASINARQAALQSERSARVAQTQQRVQALIARAASLATEQRQNEVEAELAKSRVALAGKTLARFEELAGVGFVADSQVQQKREEQLDLRTRQQSTQRNQTALQREAQSVQDEILSTRAQLQSDLAAFDRSAATLTQEQTENRARGQQVMRAPQAGVVSGVVAKLGQAVQPGQTLATLVPAQAAGSPALQAQLFVPSRMAGFVQPGQTAWLRYAAYPYQKFGMAQGQILEVSQTPLQPQDLPAGQAANLLGYAGANEPLYRISVALKHQAMQAYGNTQALKPGMTLEADVVQEHRAVWEWLFEPLLAARQKMNVSSAGGKTGLSS